MIVTSGRSFQMKLLFLIATVCLVAFSASAEDVVREENITAVLNSGDCLEISNINGEISIQEWDSDAVQAVYTITCETQEELDAIDVVCDTVNEFICEVKYNEDWNRDQSGHVNFQVKVPSDLALAYELSNVNGIVTISSACGTALLEVVNGDIIARDFNGDMVVELVNGTVTTSGITNLKQVDIVNGTINSRVDYMGSDLSISSVNGEIKIELMADASVKIETLSGDISITDSFNALIAENIAGSSASFGNGEYDLDISTVSGDIEITD
jgi:DUF4097 and DUF4098 domain-containing protein YvlB